MKEKNRLINHSHWSFGRAVRLTAPRSTCFSGMTESVEKILDYLHEAAGFTIEIKRNVPIGRSTHRLEKPLENEEQALALLKQAMAGIGCTVSQKGRSLRIITAHDAKKHYVPLPTLTKA